MPNRLAGETSPYLLQHKENPVDWYPWADEAFERAERENKPVLLSIGYSACHWCHVMEHESFENPEIARLMNELFVSIKVDREERPDLDAIYMQVTQAMTGGGGWPMTVFLTPEGVPFYAGTYFPPVDRYGHPGFPRVLEHVARVYREQPESVARTADQVRELLAGPVGALGRPGQLDPSQLDQAFQALAEAYDELNGGFGDAPKFPPAMTLELLLRHHRRTSPPERTAPPHPAPPASGHPAPGTRLAPVPASGYPAPGARQPSRALEIVEHTLVQMARGGIYDQLGGGFHRYSVDAHWLVPHFEKMLYDNALLAGLYVMAFQETGERFYRRIAEEILDYVLREMTSPEGGFYSTQDADSEGVEGKFFVWTPDELVEALGPDDARIAAAYWGVTEHGNWEHRSILNLLHDPAAAAERLGMAPDELRLRIERIRPKLLAFRERRVRPGRDDKVLTSWNGLMLRAFAEAAAALGSDRFLDAAVRNARFVLSTLRVDGRLRHSYKDGQARFNGYLEDHAYYADGLLALYQATFETSWLVEARALVDQMIERFADDESGGFYDTSHDHEQLISRPKDLYDSATPSANAVAADVLLRLALLTGETAYHDRAVRSLEAIAPVAARAPQAFGRWLCAVDFALGQPVEIAIVGDPGAEATAELLRAVRGRFVPNKVVALRAPGDEEAAGAVPLLAGRDQLDGRPAAYVCRNFACRAPTSDPDELARQLDGTQLQ
ncbi:MAG TPA: thioredoxin domain-containing protein [Chloroflexota bacterium]|jgi:hypothetical protein|nr:thioredoxin domain-containing protein [Chloroflexota bacterium]